ncbi:MAG: class I SAM-dependent methyltransferase [Woeseiaceae bacterium]|nr:class I SAM-dependent methyltransferase [Woeseiaceae bacterium]
MFGNVAKGRKPLRLIDIAGGSGSVVERATNSLGERLEELACVDLSPSAMKLLEQRFPGVHAVVADARDTGLESGRYDVVTSQFGMEYAGLDSIDEMMRLARGRRPACNARPSPRWRHTSAMQRELLRRCESLRRRTSLTRR